MNFLTEHKIEQYAELDRKNRGSCQSKANRQRTALKEVEKRLTDMTLLIKNITTYQKTKPVYDCIPQGKG